MKLRLFCAIELPLVVREEAARRIEHLREQFPRARATWERAEKMHLTLKFLGDVEETRLQSVNKVVEATASAFQPFEMSIEGAGAFPPRAQVPRVLWLGAKDDSNNLVVIQEKLKDEFARIGFKKEARAFHPHLTLARVRAPENAKELREEHERLEFKTPSFIVEEIVLMQSELLPSGSRYAKIFSSKFTS
jgi:2'-5' RNA ligase